MRHLLAVAGLALIGAAPVPMAPPPATGLTGPYDPQNPFARILRGELPAQMVYDDPTVMAFVPLSMAERGHVLVISKHAARNILDIAPEDWAHVMLVAQRIARAEVAAFHPDGISIRENNGAAAGQTVFHLHVHVIPRYDGKDLPTKEGPPDSLAEREAVAAAIRAQLR